MNFHFGKLLCHIFFTILKTRKDILRVSHLVIVSHEHSWLKEGFVKNLLWL